ncbi:hypothetical protein HK097_000034 [Rhizophlyctis rosea]|uniref:Uncharacterized protein n=1 Tax=Rhizophlyctis rosea TaxID=64517 RepID=A0AAD5SNL3_9FUNG|nr:hypothetical protein HK097_000034 [Rhizophlyctis rosea]
MPGQYAKPGDIPAQTQIHDAQPGLEHEMTPAPNATQLEGPNGLEEYKGSGKLTGKAALVTGGDSGIGRSVAAMFAREGADVAIVYREKEEKDAQETKKLIEGAGRQALLIPTDISVEANCKKIIDQTIAKFGHLEILVNNAAVQYIKKDIRDITTEQLEETYRTNIFAQFWLVKYALDHLKRGASIINTTSVTAYQGSPHLLDYSSTKGAIVGFTRSLSANLASKGIRVNAVAPGPIWTPLQPASRNEEETKSFGEKSVPLGRVGQPAEVGTSYVFLASNESSYFTGQVLHPNGGSVING